MQFFILNIHTYIKILDGQTACVLRNQKSYHFMTHAQMRKSIDWCMCVYVCVSTAYVIQVTRYFSSEEFWMHKMNVSIACSRPSSVFCILLPLFLHPYNPYNLTMCCMRFLNKRIRTDLCG